MLNSGFEGNLGPKYFVGHLHVSSTSCSRHTESHTVSPFYSSSNYGPFLR